MVSAQRFGRSAGRGCRARQRSTNCADEHGRLGSIVRTSFATDSPLEETGFEPSADDQNLGIFARTLRLLRLSPPQLDTMGGHYGEGTEDASRSVLARYLPGAETHPEGAASRRPPRSIS